MLTKEKEGAPSTVCFLFLDSSKCVARRMHGSDSNGRKTV
jgi:hypothetical protein